MENNEEEVPIFQEPNDAINKDDNQQEKRDEIPNENHDMNLPENKRPFSPPTRDTRKSSLSKSTKKKPKRFRSKSKPKLKKNIRLS